MYAYMVQGVLSAADCASLVAVAEAHAASHGGWTRGRHEAYPTTDLPLASLPRSAAAVRSATTALRDVVLPGLARGYPSLAGLPLYVDDAFVAKYDGRQQHGHGTEDAEEEDGEQGGAHHQHMLAFHKDGTPLSFICTLTKPAGGGGTVFRTLLPPTAASRVRLGDATAGVDYGPANASVLLTPAGDCVLFAGGAMMHGGVPVTAGLRHLLIGFVQAGRGVGTTAGRRYAAYRERWKAAKSADERAEERGRSS